MNSKMGSSPSSSTIRKVPPFSYLFSLLALILLFIVLYWEDFSLLFKTSPRIQLEVIGNPMPNPRQPNISKTTTAAAAAVEEEEEEEGERMIPFAVGESKSQCDVFSGRWVRDELNRPLYEESECPYIQPQLTCQEHGRPDKEYQFLRWQPNLCDIPRFNSTFMLEKLRGKRMMFVGDSLNRGQYVSMVCLLQRGIPDHAKSMQTFDSLTVFRAEEYNVSIEFYWAPFLLESNSDNAVIHRVTDRIVRKGSINKHGRYWLGADILVFNTYLWWITGMKMKILRGSFNKEKKDMTEMETDDAYRMAMKSLVRWVERNVDPEKTRVFFTSMSPSHGKSVEWGGDPNGNCFNQTSPIEDPAYWGSSSQKSIMKVINEVFSKSKIPITFLNITQLSEYRKDAHTSIYKKQWNPLTPEQLSNPVSYSDCVHWCLPGLQDTWNELLYSNLFYPSNM